MSRFIAKSGFVTVVALLLLAFFAPGAMAQGDDVEDYYARLLDVEVEVVNPVKRPVISAGIGVAHFLGDIRYAADNALMSSWAGRVNVSTLVGKSKQAKMNVFIMYGVLEGMDFEKSLKMNKSNIQFKSDETWFPNTSFSTQFYEIGFSVEYNFWHWLGKEKTVKPYVSIGAGLFIFTPKANYRNKDGEFYHFWDDGTIRMMPEGSPGAEAAKPVKMDRRFENDLKKTNLYDLNNIPPVTALLPLEVGVDFYLSDRISLRTFTSLHYVFSDMVDGFDKKVAAVYDMKANKLHDMFLYTGFSFNFDFFSQSESFLVERVFADLEDFDYDVFFSDQDGDGVIDRLDECPDTPLGVLVDSVGCPIDSDGDGVPDYLDREPNTPIGQPVDEYGVSLDDAGMTLPVGEGEAVLRKNIKLNPVSPTWSRRYEFNEGQLPEKFIPVDLDGDGVISFEEVIRAVDDYFSGQSALTPDDIYELNAYFFSQ